MTASGAMIDGSPTELSDDQIVNGWGNLGPVVVRMRRRIEALENERARNITALVEDGLAIKHRLDALEAGQIHGVASDNDQDRRLETLETQVRKNDEARHFGEGELRGYVQELGRSEFELRGRIEALEACLPRPIPVVTPLAPSPDYRSDLPAEVEACSCDEVLAMRAEIERLRNGLRIEEEETERLQNLVANERTAAESRLVAANENAQWWSDRAHSHAASIAAATALLIEARGVIYTDDGSNLGTRIQTFLANQPAAPAEPMRGVR